MNKVKILPKITLFESLLGMFCCFPFTLTSLRILQVAIIYGGAIFYLLLNSDILCKTALRRDTSRVSILLKILILAICCLCVARNSCKDFGYFTFIGGVFRGFVLYLAYGIFILKKHDDFGFYDFCFLFIKNICWYVFFTLVLLIPTVRNFWKSIVYISEGNSDLVESIVYYTRFGLQGFSGYGQTICCSIAGLCFWMLKLHNYKISWFYFALLFIGSACYGRVGLLANIILFGYFSVASIKFKKKKYVLLLVVGGVSLFVGLALYIEYFSSSYNAFSWMLEPLVNLMKGNKQLSGSSSQLKKMYIFDFNSFTLLFGDALYLDPNGNGYYRHTDVGFLRVMYYGGLILLLTYYVSQLIFLWGLFVNLKWSGKFLVFLGLLGLFAMFEAKGESCYLIYKVFFVASLFVDNKREERNGMLVCN